MPPAQVRAIVGSTGFCEADGVLTGVPRSGRAGRYVLAMGAAAGHDVLDVSDSDPS